MKIKILILALLLLPASIFAQSMMDILKPDLGKKLGTCSVCGMDVFEKMMTRVEIEVADTVYHACGIGCATAIMEGKNVKDVKVVDFKTFKLVDAKKSWFVVGSVISPVRAMLPEFSFASKKEADEFAKIYGGKVLDYQSMFDLAKKIREERKKSN
ncbi:nitrous oxide reductase accessory protein NosL [Candidatus Chrysopegis kryptomonas]|jgi:nitrous oxide reductase accessory protein NosL|uniref:NosL protein n=1 Tax=Candidatus Chryseopegocella kryptomonas TaxID=1633643 RepID=A0A0P1NVN8_9BACT|nr:nitrous oxide reductase accessory protein NosL [Candidatus Chrysopegis kryptomonas]CUT03213.1 NosL protein [Candidatus Chrysopegis kryptomonas]